MALSREEIKDIARGKAKEVLERHGIPEVIDHKVVRTVVEMGLQNCECSQEAESFAYELATIQHGNLRTGIPDEYKVAKAIEFFGNNVDERTYGAYLKLGGCAISLPYGASHKRLQELYKEDWTKANNLLGEIFSAIGSGANYRGGGACEALELLYKGLTQSNPGGQSGGVYRQEGLQQFVQENRLMGWYLPFRSKRESMFPTETKSESLERFIMERKLWGEFLVWYSKWESLHPEAPGSYSNPSSQHITIEDPGKTTFKPGEVISKDAFDKENERVRKLGEKPATGTPSVKG